MPVLHTGLPPPSAEAHLLIVVPELQPKCKLLTLYVRLPPPKGEGVFPGASNLLALQAIKVYL